MTPKELKARYRVTEVTLGEEWKLELLQEMLEERQDRLEEGEDISRLHWKLAVFSCRIAWGLTTAMYSSHKIILKNGYQGEVGDSSGYNGRILTS